MADVTMKHENEEKEPVPTPEPKVEKRYRILPGEDGASIVVSLKGKKGTFNWDTAAEVGELQMSEMTAEEVQVLVDEKKIELIV